MPSEPPTGPPTAASNATTTATATAWANASAAERPLFHAFALLDEELHATFPGLWVALMAVHGAISLAGLALNGLALYVFCCRTRAATPSVTYTLNLVVTDLLVGLSLPTRFAIFYGARGCVRCAFPHVFGYFLNMHCSALFLTCICADRYLAIVRPEGARRWRQPACARATCAVVWVAAGAVTLSVLGVAAGGRPCCRLLALTALEFLLPLLLLSAFTGRAVCALSRPGLHQGRQRRLRAVQLLLTVLVIFLVCFTPFHARQVAVALWPDAPRRASLVAYHVAVTLSSLNSCMDPIVYCFVTSGFQATVRGLFRRREVECQPGVGDMAVSVRKSSKGPGHHRILSAGPRALTQALTNGPEA